MQTVFNILTVLNSIVLALVLIAVFTKDEDNYTEELGSWWERNPNEVKETPSSKTSLTSNKTYTVRVGNSKAKAPTTTGSATTTKAKKDSGHVVQPVRKDKRQRKSR